MTMDRRSALGLVSVSLLQPRLAFAQPDSRVRRIGVLTPGRWEKSEIAEFEQVMTNLGFGVGTNLLIEWRFADDQDQLDPMAAELVRKRVDVIVALTTPAVVAAQRATKDIPIVFIGIGDPVASGFVASLARPGGNTTGTSALAHDLVVKRLDLLMRVVPKMTRVAYLFMADNPYYAISARHLEDAAKKMRVRIIVLPVKASADIESLFLAMKRERADAAIWGVDGFLTSAQMDQIGALAPKYRMPAIGATRRFARIGGLMSYSIDDKEQWELGLAYVAKILRGAKPGELPVAQPTRFELVVNMKTARLLGTAVPQDILSRASEVIE